MTWPAITYSVTEASPTYYTYLVTLHPADGLPAIRQASGACRTEAEAERRVAAALGALELRLAAIGAAPIPTRRVGHSPRRRAASRVLHAIGFLLACALSAVMLGALIALGVWLVAAIR